MEKGLAEERITKKKRVRFKIPTYRKVYSVYQYNQKKYNCIYKKLHNLALKYDENIYYKVNPYDVLRLCYIRDENNQLQSLGDEKHIFQVAKYHLVLDKIAQILLEEYNLSPDADVLKYLFKRTGLIFHSNKQVEDIFIYKMSLKDKISYHIRLLRLLYIGMEIEIAVKLSREAHKVKYL